MHRAQMMREMCVKPDDAQLAALIKEVKRNGFGDDLVTWDGSSLMTGRQLHSA